MSTDVAGLVAPRISKAKNIFLWVLQLIGAAVFFMSGFMKLSGNEQMVQMFDMIGIGHAHSDHGRRHYYSPFFVGGSPALPIGLLIAMTIVAWGRKERTLRLINRKMY